MAKLARKEGKCFHSIGDDLSGRLVPHSLYPGLYVLFLAVLIKPLLERLGLSRKFKRGEKIRG